MTLLYRLLETPVWVYAALALAVGMALRARWRLDAACGAAAEVPSRRALSGAEAAAEMLHRAGVEGVAVERGRGAMGQGYDEVARAVRLEGAVHDGRSLAAVALAAHEVGHALQHAGGDGPQPLEVRETLAIASRLGSGTAGLLLAVGLALDLPGLIAAGAVGLLGATAAPLGAIAVERDAARRARRVLAMSALVDSAEERLAGPIVEAAGGREVASILPRLRPPAWRRTPLRPGALRARGH
jgi:Zn-dependent membrane protease YugP